MRSDRTGGLVYSTDVGRTCPACRQASAACVCAAAVPARASGDGIVRVGRETRGRGGKTVTLVRGLDLELDPAALDALGKSLRSACGAGGSVKDGVVEVQGDHRARVATWLAGRGWTVKTV
ncbi:MAG: stress response translation initiation inhibitor YciH [Burkholderiaceae bacterium]